MNEIHASPEQLREQMGRRLKALRVALGLTQLRLADVMGVSCPTVSAWESGRNPIDILVLAATADRLGFTTDYIARGDPGGLSPELAVRLTDCSQSLPARSQRGRPRWPRMPAAAD
jgi:transcriptional regulator with XRE-family HTH domain